jgi:hypothetical protein
MKTKILLWSVVLVLVLGIAAGGFWWLRRPQVILMSDGAKLTLLKVDYGRQHAPPAVKASTGKPARRGGSFTTTNDELVVWVRQEFNSQQQYHYFQYFAYDEAGTACVNGEYGSMGNGQGNSVVGLRLDGFPRRQGRFFLRVLENSNGGQELSDQKFVIRNPARGSFAAWTPLPLPNTQDDDDVSVTLTKLAAGAAMPYQRNNADAEDPMNKGVQATFHVERNGHPDTNWEPVSVESSDATGNRVAATVSGNAWNGLDDTATYQYGLWPEEPAWKIHFEFSQKSNFADQELWSVRALPLQPGRQQDFWNYNGRRNAGTNAVYAQADVNGYRVKVFAPKQFSDAGPNSQPQGGMTIQVTPKLAEGMRLTLATLTDDDTNDIGNWNYGSYSDGKSITFRYGLRDLDGVTNLNLTLALHRSRFVEFTVKPGKAGDH